MNRAELNWFRLRFPRDLEEPAVLAALGSLSGLNHRARLVVQLRASSAGIEHAVAVTASDVGTLSAALRAAVPSLRMEAIDTPARPLARGLRWQLSPAVAVLRSDGVRASAAGLLSSLFPLHGDEVVHLDWHLRSAPRPLMPLAMAPETGSARALRAKLACPGLSAYGQLDVVADSPARRRQLIQRVAAGLRSLGTPHGRLVGEPIWLALLARLVGRRGRYLSAPELAAVIGWPVAGPDLPGLELGAAKRLVPASNLPQRGRVLGYSDFGDLRRPVAIPPAASTRGLYILGPTGTGKTSLLKNLIANDLAQGRGLAVVETNGDLVNDLLDLIPPNRLDDVVLLDPTDPDFSVGFNPFASSASPSLVADQLGELFQRLWAAYWGPRTGQLAHMGLLTLARRRGSTLLDLPRLFLDEDFRERLLANLDDPLGLGPDWQWFAGLSQQEQHTVIAPLMNKLRQFNARPSIRPIIGQAKPALSMRRLIAERKILLVYLPKGLVGVETTQLLGCLVLTGLWQALGERAGLAPNRRHPFGVYVDEVQDFAAAPLPWDEMFAQGRKYGLSLCVAHQNLSQLPRELREVILANARSKAVFTLSAQDARFMERLFSPALTAADLQALDAFSIAAQVALDDGSTARPVTLVTPPPPQSLDSADEVRAASRANYAVERRVVEAALVEQLTPRRSAAAPVGRRRREQS